jgi:hypothetical protein
MALVGAGPAAGAEAVRSQPNAQVGLASLDWGVKQSFRDYIEGPIAQGDIKVRPPAKRRADGTFRFPDGAGTVHPGDGRGDGRASIRFKGGVYFYGHDDGTGPQLEWWMRHPRVVINGATGTLIANVRSQMFGGGDPIVYRHLELVDLDTQKVDLHPVDGRIRVRGVGTTLTAAGADAFGGFYSAGTPFDDLGFTARVTKQRQ